MPGLGPVAATADLKANGGGTRVRLRWAYLGDVPSERLEVERLRRAKESAYRRLETLIAGTLPAIGPKE